MKTIKQTVEVNFNAIDLKDAFIIAPLVHDLINRYRSAHDLLNETYNKGKNKYDVKENLKILRQTYAQLQVLFGLGFEYPLTDYDFKKSEYLNFTPEQFYERINEKVPNK